MAGIRKLIGAGYVRQGAVTAGTVLLSVAVTFAATRGRTTAPVSAQPGPAEEVRASAFVLVGQDGTELARLVPGPLGAGVLTLYDPAGKERVVLGGGGLLRMFSPDGVTSRLSIGLLQQTGAPFFLLNSAEAKGRILLSVGPDGVPRVQMLDTDGTTTRIGFGVNPEGRASFGVFDANNTERVRLGQDRTGPIDEFRVTVRDASGEPFVSLP